VIEWKGRSVHDLLGRAKGETLEYTDQQRAAFKDAYAKRLRKQLIMMRSSLL